ncbi:hypothetical protein VTG60DRAFT_3887 [Thermothelomyces hinnuleus]
MDPGVPCPDGAVLHDIIIVGAGPCGLAVAARLRERNPAALFTDEEHRRFHWMRRHGRKMALRDDRSQRVSRAAGAGSEPHEYDMVVLDADADDWMGRWNRLFDAFDIDHLRSPMFWHVDPGDRDSLLSKAYMQGREGELMEIKNCVGKEVSKHQKKKKRMMGARSRYVGARGESRVHINERDRHDYFNPSRALFRDHCRDVVDRYGLGGARGSLVRKERVLDIAYGPVAGVSGAGEKLFTVRTEGDAAPPVRHARVVILAVGAGNPPRIPAIPGIDTGCSTGAEGGAPPPPPPQVSHAMHLRAGGDEFPLPRELRQKIPAGREVNILVVGAGLTSAQLSDLAIRRTTGTGTGTAMKLTVYHLTRARLRTRLFDVGLDWMGKFRNGEQARFWTAASDAERLALLREARGGGSITPRYRRILRHHAEAGRLRLLEGVQIVRARFQVEDEQEGRGVWCIRIRGGPRLDRETGDGGKGKAAEWKEEEEEEKKGEQEEAEEQELPPMDWIYFATGVETDFEALPFLRTMLESYPIPGQGGLPCLNDDLMWKDGVPLFVAGRLAALRLGPAAPNLGGARLAAERIAWAVEDLIRDGAEGGGRHASASGRAPARGVEDEDEGLVAAYARGAGSMFRSLAEVPA